MGTPDMHTCVPLGSGEPYVLGEDVFSSSATEVDECLEEWLTTDVAERLMEFLKRELPSE